MHIKNISILFKEKKAVKIRNEDMFFGELP